MGSTAGAATAHSTHTELSSFRKLFWPVHNYELKKFLPMVLMMFFFLFNYTIMRDTKDTLVVTAAGAEVIPFLKFWGTLPMSVVFVLVYAKLSNILEPERLFYTLVTPFLLFFTLFGYVIYPNIGFFEPIGMADQLQGFVTNYMPLRMHSTLGTLVDVFRVWPYAVFYVASELWGSMGISLLFWQFANHITKTHEAKRFYAGFAQLGNLALVASGLTIIYCSDIRKHVPQDVDAWGVSLRWLMGAVALGCIIIMMTYRWMQRNVLTDPALFDPKSDGGKKKAKLKLSMKESFKFLTSSPYLGYIAVLVLAYGVSINLIEVVWKAHIKMQFPDPNDYNTFMGYFSMFTGFTTLFLVIIGSNVIRRLGWKIAALASPVTLLTTGGLFFAFVLFREQMGALFSIQNMIWATVLIGAVQNILSKATKYSLFDPTKEMAYIPLDPEAKTKGKAAIDIVGARLGKSGGGIILQVILASTPLMASLPLLLSIIGVVVGCWIMSVLGLSKLYNKKVSATSDADADGEADSSTKDGKLTQQPA